VLPRSPNRKNSTFSWDKAGRRVALLPGQSCGKRCHELTSAHLVEQGPDPIVNGQAQGLPDNPVTGAVP